MPTRYHLLVSLVILAGVPLLTSAQELRQERLFALIPEYPGAAARRVVEIDTRRETFGAFLAVWPGVQPAAGGDSPLYALAGGRYIVWTSGTRVPSSTVPFRLHVFDTRLGAIFAIDNAIYGSILAVDPYRPCVFLAEPDRVAVVDARTATIAYMPRPASEAGTLSQPPAAYAAEADRLFMGRMSDPTLVDVYDVATRTIVRTLSVGTPFDNAVGLATEASGARLFAVTQSAALTVYDTATSSLLGAVPTGIGYTYRIQHDEHRRRLLIGDVVAFDSDTLARLGQIDQVPCPAGVGCLRDGAFTLVGPRSPLVFYSSNMFLDPYTLDSRCAVAPLERRDGDTGQLERVVDLAPLLTNARTGLILPHCAADMVMITTPAQPRSFASQVHGRQVTLSWSDPGNTTHFEIEAGSAPGLNNLLRQSVGGTTLTVNDVPRGVYHVRVRAVNEVGRSLPSEIAVVVE